MIHTVVQRKSHLYLKTRPSFETRRTISNLAVYKKWSLHRRIPLLFLQRRKFSISQDQAFDLLESRGVPLITGTVRHDADLYFTVSINRSLCQPQITMERAIHDKPETLLSKAQLLYQYGQPLNDLTKHISSVSWLPSSDSVHQETICTTLLALVGLFREKEASFLQVGMSKVSDKYAVISASFVFDDAAVRSAKRQQDINSLRDVANEVPAEVEAEKYGIVYIR